MQNLLPLQKHTDQLNQRIEISTKCKLNKSKVFAIIGLNTCRIKNIHFRIGPKRIWANTAWVWTTRCNPGTLRGMTRWEKVTARMAHQLAVNLTIRTLREDLSTKVKHRVESCTWKLSKTSIIKLKCIRNAWWSRGSAWIKLTNSRKIVALGIKMNCQWVS